MAERTTDFRKGEGTTGNGHGGHVQGRAEPAGTEARERGGQPERTDVAGTERRGYGVTGEPQRGEGRYYSAARTRTWERRDDERQLGAGYPRDEQDADYERRYGGGEREHRMGDRIGRWADKVGDRIEHWGERSAHEHHRGHHGRLSQHEGTAVDRARAGLETNFDRAGWDRGAVGTYEHGRAGFGDFGTPSYSSGRELRQGMSDRDFPGRDDRIAGRSGESFHPEQMGGMSSRGMHADPDRLARMERLGRGERSWRTPEEEWERTHYRGGVEERRARIWEREPTQARDVMTANPKSVRRDATLREVAQIMRDENCGIVPVVDDGMRLIGLITDRDIVMRTLDNDRNWRELRAHEVMTDEIECVTPEDSVHEAIHLMGRKQVRRVPVVDRNDRLLGMISMADVANRANDDEELQHALDKISKRRSFWSRMWT